MGAVLLLVVNTAWGLLALRGVVVFGAVLGGLIHKDWTAWERVMPVLARYGAVFAAASIVVAADYFHAGKPVGGIVWTILAIFEWHYRDKDHWKRKRRRAAARVKELAGRLVVVPEPEAT